MTSLVHRVWREYNDLVENNETDPIVDSWLLMKSPIPVVLLLGSYLYFVLKLGPKLMEKRKPHELKYVLIVYNAYQVLFSFWLCSKVVMVKDVLPYIYNYNCKNPRPNVTIKYALADAAWWYFFSKVVEFLDTIFFVLRKKQSQVTFLHVYHHSATMFFSWCYLKFFPGEQGVFIGFLNSFVHVIMYTYYLIAALGPKYQKYLWWKKYMTRIQLTQFCIMLAYLGSIIAYDCKLSKGVTFFFVANVIVFLYLFSDFYRKAYKKNKADSLRNHQMMNGMNGMNGKSPVKYD